MFIRCDLIVIVFLCFALVNIFYLKKQVQAIAQLDQQLNPMDSYIGHDFPEDLPLPVNLLPVIPVLFEESVHYSPLGNVSDPEWFSLTPEGFGYTRLGEDHRVFAVTMFHEMHCLRILNLAFSKTPIASPEHIQHCLNYLRQGALCSSDLSLEPGNFEEKDFDVERTGSVHMCTDWEVVYEAMHKSMARWLERNKTHIN